MVNIRKVKKMKNLETLYLGNLKRKSKKTSRQHVETIKLKKDFKRAKEEGFNKGLKKFAKTHDLGNGWMERKVLC